MTNPVFVITENTSKDEISNALESAFGQTRGASVQLDFSFTVEGKTISDKHGAVGTSVTLSHVAAAGDAAESYTFIVQGLRAGVGWHRSGKPKGFATLADAVKVAASDTTGSYKRAAQKAFVADAPAAAVEPTAE